MSQSCTLVFFSLTSELLTDMTHNSYPLPLSRISRLRIFDLQHSNTNARITGTVCYEDDLDVSEMYVLRCPSNHQFCLSCLGSDLKIRSEGNGEIAKCLGHQCDYPISTREVLEIMHRDVGENNESNSIVSRHVESLVKVRLTSLSNESLSSPCPAPDCLGWQVSKTYTKFQRSRLLCGFCGFTYCSSCRAPFHYNCGCKQVLRVAQRWADWLRADREKYLRDVGVEARKKFMELQSRAKQVREDEAYLAKTCRLCPKCDRRVEKLGGCDLMICGRDWHGGNNQQGCGAHFKWSEAKPYVFFDLNHFSTLTHTHTHTQIRCSRVRKK